MMFLKKKITVLALPAVAILSTACATTTPGPSDESGFSKEIFNVEALTCWDLATISEDDAGYAATLLYGYSQGKAGESYLTPSKIENALSELSRKCAGNPDMLILDTFK